MIGQDNVVIFVRYGGTYVRVHESRILHDNDKPNKRKDVNQYDNDDDDDDDDDMQPNHHPNINDAVAQEEHEMYNQDDNDSEPENENSLNDKHMADYETDNTQQEVMIL